MTKAKDRMTLASKSDVALWVQGLRESPERTLAPLLDKRVIAEAELFEVHKLLQAYDPEKKGRVTAVGLGRALSSAGFRQVNDGVPVRVGKDLMRLYAIRNIEKWHKAGLSEIQQHWKKYFGAGSIGK